MGRESFLVVTDTTELVSDVINIFCVTSVQTNGENTQQLKAGLHNLVFKQDNPSAVLWLWHCGGTGVSTAVQLPNLSAEILLLLA